MRFLSVMAVLLSAAIVSPVLSQPYNFFETHEQLERRRQAEQYYYEQEQRRRGNLLNTQKPLGLREAPSAASSAPARKPAESYDPNRRRECPPNHYLC